jgi:hypothetical protein
MDESQRLCHGRSCHTAAQPQGAGNPAATLKSASKRAIFGPFLVAYPVLYGWVWVS